MFHRCLFVDVISFVLLHRATGSQCAHSTIVLQRRNGEHSINVSCGWFRRKKLLSLYLLLGIDYVDISLGTSWESGELRLLIACAYPVCVFHDFFVRWRCSWFCLGAVDQFVFCFVFHFLCADRGLSWHCQGFPTSTNYVVPTLDFEMCVLSSSLRGSDVLISNFIVCGECVEF